MSAHQRGWLVLTVVSLALAAGCGGDKHPTAIKPNPCATPTGALTLGGTTNGDLTVATCQFSDTSRIQSYTLVLTQPTAVDFSVDATNNAFDPVAILYRNTYTDTAGVIAFADDDPSDTLSFNPRLHTVLAAGTYVLAVNHYKPDFGPYTLRAVAASGSAEHCVDPYVGAPALWMTPGTSANQTLTATDCAFGTSQYADYVGIYLNAGQGISVSTSSLGTPTQIYFYGRAGTTVASDANPTNATSARITYTAPSAGLYSFIVTAPSGTVGEYTLTIGTSATAAPAAVAGAVQQGPAWTKQDRVPAFGRVKSGR
ncbi:MAG TPA: PPC domain-containing protein [Gemmatimonadaceae bacterium]|nr:PPC domain-containing protein [Gemmatimonadaceae bacterium]